MFQFSVRNNRLVNVPHLWQLVSLLFRRTASHHSRHGNQNQKRKKKECLTVRQSEKTTAGSRCDAWVIHLDTCWIHPYHEWLIKKKTTLHSSDWRAGRFSIAEKKKSGNCKLNFQQAAENTIRGSVTTVNPIAVSPVIKQPSRRRRLIPRLVWGGGRRRNQGRGKREESAVKSP